tara:strand:- start:6174 stop:6371 length:198 start_codon:yes stop_codon:yes gene_type:complete
MIEIKLTIKENKSSTSADFCYNARCETPTEVAYLKALLPCLGGEHSPILETAKNLLKQKEWLIQD